jgi:hypothetical protein
MKKIAIAAAVMLLGSSGAWAAGTAAGTSIVNSATLSYSVSGTSQTDIDSNNDTFVVDKKIDFILTHEDSPKHVEVAPKQNDVQREFKLTNQGNEKQDFSLAVSNLSGDTYDSKTDNKNADNLEISVDSGANWSTTATIDDLAVGDNKTILVRGDIPDGLSDNDIINIQLEARAIKDSTATPPEDEENTGGAGDADRQGTKDTVLGEGDGVTDYANTEFDGKYSAWGGYIVTTPELSLTKKSCVLGDGVTANAAHAKRIPGATLIYVFDIENTATLTDASDVNLTDTHLDETYFDLTGTVASLYVEKDVSAACKCDNGSAHGGDNSGTDDTGNVTATKPTANTIKLEDLSITHGTHTCASFTVKIK